MSSYLEHPLIQTGMVLFCLFGIFKVLLSSRLLLPVSQREAAPIIHKILNFGFVLAVIVAIFGFGLESWKIYKQIDLIMQAKHSIAAEVISDISSIDERLQYIENALEPDSFQQHLDSVRNRVAPKLSSQLASGYTRLLIEQKITTLRQLFNSSPLRTAAGRSELENLNRSGMDTENYQEFYDQLAEVERVTEDFFSVMASGATVNDRPSETQTQQHEERLRLAVRSLEVESQYAYVLALHLLLDVTKPPHAVPFSNSADAVLRNLQHLEPRRLPNSLDEVQALLSRSQEQRTEMVTDKASLLATNKQRLEEKLTEFSETRLLRIDPSDAWHVVVGKAISLRQLGRTSEAIAAFSLYADMFTKTDATAQQYARTAQQLTMQMESLNLQGGAYIFEVRDDSTAQRAGLRTGDVIIEYDNHPVTDMETFVEATKSARIADMVNVVWLRLNSQGEFHQYRKTVPGGSLGAGLMPI